MRPIIPTADNPASATKLRFARRFLRSLSKMSRTRPSCPSSICVKKRSEGLKMAAYWCMARAVGSRRAWSRAILMKLSRGRKQHHPHHHNFSMKRKIRRSTWLGKTKKKQKKKKKNITCSSSSSSSYDEDEEGLMKRQTEKLREVVPGGKLMDTCSLLEETAHFVTCLAAQVHVMQTIAHHYS
ncbi:hypothetical protein K1719_014042 [Acacia pycnantha]|nr:hypothetical protein K1719_014042 [Acacia pycnantha]